MTTQYIDMTENLVPIEQPIFHFLVHNIFEWRTGDSLPTLIKEMDKQKMTYWIWYVPGDKDTRYEIQFYRPQVKGAFVLDAVEYENGKRVMSKSIRDTRPGFSRRVHHG